MTLTFNGTTSAGALTFPISVPTGSPGEPRSTRTSTDVPKAIPDNNPTGVTSTLNARRGGGTITDVNVRVGQ